MRRKCFALLLAIALLLLSGCGFEYLQSEQAEMPETALQVSFLDVGQADAALVFCEGEYMLIDGGNVDDGPYVVTSLQERGVQSLAYVVNSHCDEDHCGGLTDVLEAFDAAHVFSSTTAYSTRAFTNFAAAAQAQRTPIEIPSPGDTFRLGSAEVTMLGPLRDYGNNNENSIVLRIDYGETSFLFTGDIGLTAEDELVESGVELHATVLKVAHHGSAGSSGYVFLREVMPEYGVISVGAGNDYGHPTDAALSRLRDADVTLYRTDLQGTVTAVSDGKTVSFVTERSADESDINPTILDRASSYIGNVNSKVFHRDDCGSLPSEKNRVVFDSYQDALDAGYTPHKSCLG